jgi:hypothetical protein
VTFVGARLLDAPASAALLDEIARAARPGAVVAFDLDSTLLDNRPRQAEILREYAVAHGLDALRDAAAEHWRGWDARIAMRNGGLDEAGIETHFEPFRRWWHDRFFTSAYCERDRPIAGAVEFAAAIAARGAIVAYVTGRHEEMRAGTVACFANHGFPRPDGAAVELLMKPTLAEHDDAYKARTYAELRGRGEVIAAFDNEPTHINGYRAAFPGARCVHLATDHSMREVAIADGVVSIVDFRR